MVRMSSEAPMGQQVHEAELRAAIARVFGDGYAIVDRVLLPMRARHRAGRRLPLRLVWAAPYPLSRVIGTLAYSRADLVHRLDLRAPPCGRQQVLTIHDLCPVRFDDEGSLPRWAGKSARSAAAVICPSEFAAQEVRDLLGVTRTVVVPNGVDFARATAEPLTHSELADLDLAGPLVVHAGGGTARKNLRLLAAAWPQVLAEHPDAHLAMVGPPHAARAEMCRTLSNVRYLGYRPTSFVARLIRTASVVVVPSVYEGFGLPALEAMLACTTVVAAARGALPEVCEGAGLVVEPEPDEFASAVGAALKGGPTIERLRAAGRERASRYSWERAARETVAVYESVLS